MAASTPSYDPTSSTRRLRVLINVEALAPTGGIAWSALQVAEGLAARGHELHVLYRYDGELRRDWEAITASLTHVPGFTVEARSPAVGLARLPKAVMAAREVAPDVVWCNRSEQLLWAAAVKWATGARVVCHLRHHPFNSRAIRPMRSVADRYLAVSSYIADEWIAAGLSADRVQIVHNGIDAECYPFGSLAAQLERRAELDIPADAFVALYAGRTEAEKGVDVLMAAWHGLQLDRPAVLLLVGPGGEVAWPHRTFVGNGGPREIRSFPQTRDMTPLLHASDTLVLPALWHEPFGRVVIEAMASGRPAIASAVGGIPEILTGEFARYLVRPGDVGSLDRTLEAVAKMPENKEELGGRCRRHVVDNFGLERVITAVETALTDAVGMSKKRMVGC